jgi:threonine dehydrogenase-like Zn-dependent dehydrogenase
MNANTMRYRPDGSIELLDDVSVADPGPGEIQLHGGVCGICSWDVNTVKLGSKIKWMAPPGHEGMGYVARIGTGVRGFKEGDRVAAGGFATVRNVRADQAYAIPDSALPDTAWVVEPVSCAVTGLDHCRLMAGQRVAVIGSGFMGLLILQGLLHAPLDQVVALDVSPVRIELARKIGVPEVYNSADADRAALVDELKRRDFDVVVDTTGTQSGLDLATEIVRTGGLINLFGWIKGERAGFDPSLWHGGGFTVVNSSPSARLRDPFPPAIRLMHRGVFDLQPLVTHVAPLAGYPVLMDGILHGDGSYVKGVITLSP